MTDDLAVGRWVTDRARVTPDRPAIEFRGAVTTYRQLDERSDRLATALGAIGLVPGDRVATLSQNRPEHVELFFACAKAGFVLAPLSWRLGPPELSAILDDADPAVLFTDGPSAGLGDGALELAAVRPHRATLDREYLDALPAPAGGARSGSDGPTAESPLLLIYTSGTTGSAKGAVLTHGNTFWTNLAFDRVVDVRPTDVVLQVLPQFHVGGWNVQSLLALWRGATLVLEPSFDAARALDLIERRGVTSMMGVPATYLFLAEEDRFDEADLSSLRRAVVGGAPMPVALLDRWHRRGVGVVQGYGLTEAAPNVLCLPPSEARSRAGWAGLPYPHVTVALRADDGSLIDGPGRGELLVKGPNVFAGYWRRPHETRAAFTDDGWLRTGDIAERDPDGYLRICDRLNDRYISGGENVHPAEVEAVLFDHGAVVDAAVVGVPDSRWGEVGLAVVVVRTGATVTEADLLAHCRQRLARFKVPVAVRFVDELPRSSVHKVLRGEIRATYGGTRDV